MYPRTSPLISNPLLETNVSENERRETLLTTELSYHVSLPEISFSWRGSTRRYPGIYLGLATWVGEGGYAELRNAAPPGGYASFTAHFWGAGGR